MELGKGSHATAPENPIQTIIEALRDLEHAYRSTNNLPTCAWVVAGYYQALEEALRRIEKHEARSKELYYDSVPTFLEALAQSKVSA